MFEGGKCNFVLPPHTFYVIFFKVNNFVELKGRVNVAFLRIEHFFGEKETRSSIPHIVPTLKIGKKSLSRKF